VVSAATVDPAREAEILKLGRLLGREPASLSYLQQVPAGDLRVLRQLTNAALFDEDSEVLKRLAAAGKLLPTGVVAAISERAFGPLLAARVAGVMEPQRAADVGRHLAPTFLADVCVQLDPRAAREIVPRMDLETVLAVTGELLDRADYVTLGRFVGAMPDAELAAILEITEDDELVRVCAVAESADGVTQIFGMLSGERLASLRRRAGEKDLTHEARILGDWL
jgi:hypothetical protein